MIKKIFSIILPLVIWIIIIYMLMISIADMVSIANETKLYPCKEFLTIKSIAIVGKKQTDTLWVNYFQLQNVAVAYSSKDNSIGIGGIIDNRPRYFAWSEKLGYHEYIGNNQAILLTEEQIIPLVKILLDQIIIPSITY